MLPNLLFGLATVFVDRLPHRGLVIRTAVRTDTVHHLGPCVNIQPVFVGLVDVKDDPVSPLDR